MVRKDVDKTAVGGELPELRSQSVRRAAFDDRPTVANVLARLGAEVAPGAALISDSGERERDPLNGQAAIRGAHSPPRDREPLGALEIVSCPVDQLNSLQQRRRMSFALPITLIEPSSEPF